jgi:hypothetical protein
MTTNATPTRDIVEVSDDEEEDEGVDGPARKKPMRLTSRPLTRAELLAECRARYRVDVNLVHVSPRDARIAFDDSVDPATGERRHDYHVQEVPPGSKWTSATGALHKCFRPFNAKKMAPVVAEKAAKALEKRYEFLAELAEAEAQVSALRQSDTPTPVMFLSGPVLFSSPRLDAVTRLQAVRAKEARLSTPDPRYVTRDAKTGEMRARTAEEVQTYWDQNRDAGTDKHTMYEQLVLGRPLTEEEETERLPLGCLRFHHDHPTRVPYRTEWRVFDEASLVCGSPDMVWCQGILSDWKNYQADSLFSASDTDLLVSLGFGLPLGVVGEQEEQEEEEDKEGKKKEPAAAKKKASSWAPEKAWHPLLCKYPDCKLVHCMLQLNLYRALIDRHHPEYVESQGRFHTLEVINFPPEKPHAYQGRRPGPIVVVLSPRIRSSACPSSR